MPWRKSVFSFLLILPRRTVST